MQEILGFLKPESTWRPPLVSELPSSWAGLKRVGLDTETRDPTLKTLGPGGGRRPDSYSVGASLAFEDGPSFYLPTRHQGGDNCDWDVYGYLRDMAKTFDGQLVGMNLGYDLDILGADDVEFKQVKYFRDVQVADVIINELENAYNLNAILGRLGLPQKDEVLLKQAAQAYGVDPKSSMWKLPARYVGPYADYDARAPLLALRKQEFKIEANGQWDIFNLESELLPVLIRLRRRGILIDQDKLAEVERWSLNEEIRYLQEVKHLTGVNIKVGDVWKAAAIAPALENIGIVVGKTPTGKYSIDKDYLNGLEHPVGKAIAHARKVNKLRTTFAASVRNHMTNGRIHCVLNQMARESDDNEDDVKGGRYGRMSSEHPNLQQQPSKDEFAAFWRSIYKPEPGEQWMVGDYSQQEPRMTVHFAEVMKYEKAFEAAEQYRTNPDTDNHQMMADLAQIPRKAAKEIFLGLCYGMGGAKLCRKLGLPTARIKNWKGNEYEGAGPEGQALLDKFDAEVPFVRKLAQRCQQVAKQRGYIITLGGRHLHFPKDDSGAYDWTHKALNRLIQGSSADQTKRAMVEVDRAGHTILLQVHDEIDCSIKNKDEAEAIAKIMRDCMPLNVPSKVDIEIGPSWGEAK